MRYRRQDAPRLRWRDVWRAPLLEGTGKKPLQAIFRIQARFLNRVPKFDSWRGLLELDPDTLQVVKRIPFYGRELSPVAAGGGSVWVIAGAVDAVLAGGGSYDDSVIQLDPRSGRIIRTIPVGSSSSKHTNLCGIAATNDAVWVSVGDAGCDTNAQ